ncbi:MAG: flippase-like domain-containing protein, partial [Chloroflexi bacterium]|nr:flippase-like domain-containing protein [Chloroflexota bacterium]
MSRRWGGIIGLLLTIIFAGLALYRLDLATVISTLASANYFLLPFAAIFTLVGYIFRTARWRFILAPAKDISLPRLFPVLIIGFAANNLLPARLGEFVRAYLLGSKENISKSLSFATIVLERILDGLTLIAILALVSLFVPLPGWSQQLGVVATLVFIFALLALFLLLYQKDRMLRLLQILSAPLPSGLR